MGFNVLIDGFTGDAETIYRFTVEEMERRRIEGVTFDYAEEVESKKLFRSGEKTRSLRVSYRFHRINVLAYQVGNSFVLSVRKTHSSEPEKAAILYDLLVTVFEVGVDRSARRALARLLGERNYSPLPPGLEPADVFF
ncbi:MAG TPA: hypothetical protein VOA87_13545 [Thermoanaerobaculia bacterium]|nr:hypothetical protein [Thermoanaerobaculia bacterium]